MDSLHGIADKIINSQSFSFVSFKQAEQTIHFTINGANRYCRYDRLSFCMYDNNLEYSEDSQLGKLLAAWETSHSREELKSRIEYLILFRYAQLHVEFLSFKVRKETRPDFVIETIDGKTIGLEVTRFTKENENLVRQIIKQYEGLGLPVNEILREVQAKHGKKAQTIKVGYFESGALWCHDPSGYVLDTAQFLSTANTKYRKYKDMAQDFDDFILLCDACEGITITSELNAVGLLNEILEANPSSCIRPAILYRDNCGNMYCTEVTAASAF